jgi:hypothetical protein
MRSASVAIAIAAAIALTGCVPQPSTSTEPTPQATTPTPTASTSSPAPVHDDGEVTAVDEASPESQRDAARAAEAAVAALARRDLDYQTWWTQLLPHLSQQAGVAYEGTDPTQIPVHAVTGPGTVLPGSTELSLIVQIPTDVGLYNVTLTRANTSAPWLADRIRPAEG